LVSRSIAWITASRLFEQWSTSTDEEHPLLDLLARGDVDQHVHRADQTGGRAGGKARATIEGD